MKIPSLRGARSDDERDHTRSKKVQRLSSRLHDRVLVVVRFPTTSARRHCEGLEPEAIPSRQLQHHCLDCDSARPSYCRPDVRQGWPTIHFRRAASRRCNPNLPCWHCQERIWTDGPTLLHRHPRWLVCSMPGLEHWLL